MLADIIRDRIRELGETSYSIQKATGLSHSVVTRFLNGDRDIRLETAGVLCNHLGLKLTERK
jgi:plasmid maintenance system antidote protein VapI